MLNEEVRNIMSKDPVVVGPTDTIESVSNTMVQKRLQQLPVVENGILLGLITSYDLWKNSSKPDGKEQRNLVKDVMTTRILTIEPKAKVGTAAELFMDKRFKTLPVVNLRNELKGVITAFDVIKFVLKREYPTPILYKEVLNG
ncbi:MAG: HPP family protein [Saprospiraceae bacterium]